MVLYDEGAHMLKLNVKQKKVLKELIANGRMTDKEISKRLGYSQPTVTRTRKKLETDGYILRYCIIPNLSRLGNELLAVIAFASSKEADDVIKKGIAWTMKNRRIIFASMGEGFNGRTRLIITIHKNFTDYEGFLNDFRKRWTRHGLTELTSFIIPLRSVIKMVAFEELIRE